MSAPGDNSYLITGKVCPPKLPMQKIAPEGWSSLTPSLLDSLFNEVPVQGRQASASNSLCALSFQASVWLSTDGLSASSVGGLPYFLCNFCDYHTDSKAKLLQHVVCRHVFRCKLCEFVSFSLHELVQHQLHKHLDAEEMQPVLNSKMVLMNFSLFQRNMHIFSQCDSISNDSKSSDGRPVESEITNSSVINTSEVCPTGHCNIQSQPDNDQLEDVHIKYESPVTSSKDESHYIDVEVQEDNSAFSKPPWSILKDSSKIRNSSKRNYVREGVTDFELSPKRFRSTCNENVEASHDLFDLNQNQSSQMPHFLDDSDSYVTSSCSPHKTTSPVVSEMGHKQKSVGKNQSKAEETYTTNQVLSFFMEPTSSAVSRDFGKSDARHRGNSTAEFDPLPKTGSLYVDLYCESASKAEDVRLSRMHKTLPECSRTDQSIFSAVSKEVGSQEEGESNQSQISVLSKDDLLEQSEKETSERSLDPLLESCTDILEILQQRNHLLQQRSFASHKAEVYISNTDSVPDKRSRGRQSYCQDVMSEDVENFLLLPGNLAEMENTKENNSSVGSRTDPNEFVKHRASQSDQAPLTVHEKESYDLLRRLLLGTAKRNSLPDTATTKSEEKLATFSAGKDVSNFHLPQTNEEVSEFQSHSPVVTRASDMSLRDLLTQGLGTIHHNLFFECSYCHFKSGNKAESQKHTKVCEFRSAQIKTKTLEILMKPDDEVGMMKTETSSPKCKSLDNDYSSETFVASELLKGLSEHYSDSLGSDSLLHDKSPAVKNQLYACDKANTLQSENQISVHDKTCVSKNSGQTYLCNKSPVLTNNSQIYSYNKSQMLKQDDQIGTSISRNYSEVLRRKQISKENELNDIKHDIEDSEQNEDENELNEIKHDIEDSEQNDEQAWDYYSEALYVINNLSSCDRPGKSNVKTGMEERLSVSLNKKHDLNIDEESCGRDPNLFSESQKKFTCIFCDFASNNINFVRQHLFGNHPTNASFVEVLMPSKGKTLLYLCRGVQSTCTFISSKSTEIFKHIKMCYSGCLDNFMYSHDKVSPDYSHVLFCLGQVSGLTNTSTAMYHCLRCSYCVPDFQQMSDHISDNHASLVAGVLSVNRSFIEPRIRMVCLICKSQISVKHWSFHRCRKRFENNLRRDVAEWDSRDPCASKLETILRLSSLTGYQSCHGSSSSIESSSLASEIGVGVRDFSDQINCKSQMKVNQQSISSTENINNHIKASDSPGILPKSFHDNTFSKAVCIKQEIPDIALQELQKDDIAAHFQQQEQLELENYGTGLMPFRDIETNPSDIESNRSGIESSRTNQKVTLTNSPQTCSRKLSSGSSVLHSLLTASGNTEMSQQGFSSLHKLLQPDVVAEENRPSRATIPALPADFMSAAADLHSQYPCILEILKRQESASQQTGPADGHSPPPPPSTPAERQLKEESAEFLTRRPSSILLNALCHPDVLPQPIHSSESACLPKLHLLLPVEASDKGPLPRKASASTPEGQDMTGPFTNLLQLLCQSKKSGP